MKFLEKYFFDPYRIFKTVRKDPCKISYAQCGEDIIIDCALQQIGCKKPTYLDIGAFHPVHLSNTYFFYRAGGAGVCVEPNTVLCHNITRRRPRDVCLNVGVGRRNQSAAKFFVMNPPTLSTFDQDEATRTSQFPDHEIIDIRTIPIVTISDILQEYFSEGLDIISIDIEGDHLGVISEVNFANYRPKIWCVETARYHPSSGGTKLYDVSEFMEKNGFFCYADTYINSIFVDKFAWQGAAGV